MNKSAIEECQDTTQAYLSWRGSHWTQNLEFLSCQGQPFVGYCQALQIWADMSCEVMTIDHSPKLQRASRKKSKSLWQIMEERDNLDHKDIFDDENYATVHSVQSPKKVFVHGCVKFVNGPS